MTKNEAARATEISDRRIAALQANGDDKRYTVAWRDAMIEAQQIRWLSHNAK